MTAQSDYRITARVITKDDKPGVIIAGPWAGLWLVRIEGIADPRWLCETELTLQDASPPTP